MSSLEQLIEAQLRDASPESQGAFTISLQEALRKLGQFASFHQDQWVLTMVQALLAMESRSIYVIHKGLEIWFVGHNFSYELLPRFEEIHSQVLLEEGPQGLFGRALAAMLARPVQQLWICQWESPEREPRVVEVVSNPRPPKIRPMLPAQGQSLAVYVRLFGYAPDLTELLPYPLQYCPVPVHLLEHGWLLKSDQDVRTMHWLNQGARCPLYPADLQTSISTPLLIDCYESTEAPAFLLKPPGGDDLTYFADWCDHSAEFCWMGRPGVLDGTVSQGRYSSGLGRPTQCLSYQASKAIGNSFLSQKGSQRVDMQVQAGDFLLMVEKKPGPDRILPIKHGTVLASILNQLKIPGVVVVADASELPTDLGGLSLVRDQRFREWVQTLRIRVESALQGAVKNPPQSHGRLSMLSTMAGTGAVSLGLACLDGLQGTDLMALTHGGFLGGGIVYGVASFFRHYAPDSWFPHENEKLLAELSVRLEAATRARTQGG